MKDKLVYGLIVVSLLANILLGLAYFKNSTRQPAEHFQIVDSGSYLFLKMNTKTGKTWAWDARDGKRGTGWVEIPDREYTYREKSD